MKKKVVYCFSILILVVLLYFVSPTFISVHDKASTLKQAAACQFLDTYQNLVRNQKELYSLDAGSNSWVKYVTFEEKICGHKLTLRDDRIFDSVGAEILLEASENGVLVLKRRRGVNEKFVSLYYNELEIHPLYPQKIRDKK